MKIHKIGMLHCMVEYLHTEKIKCMDLDRKLCREFKKGDYIHFTNQNENGKEFDDYLANNLYKITQVHHKISEYDNMELEFYRVWVKKIY